MVLERWRPGFDVGPFWMATDGDKNWMPAIDIFEKKDKFVVKAELPGMKEDDIDVSVIGGTLTISGEKETETEVNEEDYYHSERSYGNFMRAVSLPSNVNTDKIEAKYEDGVLEITLPKIAELKPKKVKVAAKKKAAHAEKAVIHKK
jgi:HSP20 family protein